MWNHDKYISTLTKIKHVKIQMLSRNPSSMINNDFSWVDGNNNKQ